jgi:hypothetical protein
MTGTPRRRIRALFQASGLALLAAGPALADGPYLGIHTTGAFVSYPVADITRMSLASDTLFVETSTESDAYPLASVVRIDFEPISTGVAAPRTDASLPAILHLFPNRPNPFSPETRIAYRLPRSGMVKLRVYAVSGRHVRDLVSGEAAAGLHDVFWDGCDDDGRRVAPGVYFYQLVAPGVDESRRMILLQ